MVKNSAGIVLPLGPESMFRPTLHLSKPLEASPPNQDKSKVELSGLCCQEVLMKRTRFRETQIFGILKQADAGFKVKDLCRGLGSSEPPVTIG